MIKDDTRKCRPRNTLRRGLRKKGVNENHENKLGRQLKKNHENKDPGKQLEDG